MTNQQTFEKYFKDIVQQMSAENKKVPVDKFRSEITGSSAKLFAPSWFWYMIFGRGPGKAPPPDAMLDHVKRNPDVVEQLRVWFKKNISEKSAAYVIGNSIAERGTRIYRGEVKGVGFLEAMETNMPDLLKELLKNEAIKIQTSLHQVINK